MRVILFGFDGLRPDLVTEAASPNICRVIAEGTRFANARSVFPSETRVATPSLATGCRPASHGLVANALYDAAAAPDRVLNTKHAKAMDALVAAHGRLLERPSLGAILHAAGRRMDVVWTGTLGAARAAFPEAGALGAFRWHPEEAVGAAEAFGPGPEAAVPNTPRVRHAARLFVDHVLGLRRPDVALFWASEPDVSFHYEGIGAATSREALRDADAALGEVLAWRDAQPDRDGIVVIAMSDHGHVTGQGRIDLVSELSRAGFASGRRLAEETPIALGGGGAPGLWVKGSDGATIRALCAWLQEQPWVGLVLARAAEAHGLAGTVPLAALGALHARSPDLAFTFAGSDEPDQFGLPGRAFIEVADVPEGGGMHGGLHRRELAAFLAMAGGPVPRGRVAACPSDLTDIAPTILSLFGIAPEGMDGVPLAEALGGAEPAPARRFVLHGHGDATLAMDEARGRTYPAGTAHG
ncbi:alkaline phosphatase family protein [Elioraea rosea]|uniref:alkaline phosphatase family protein n=1 Tax=Elioraea rosea TaxID=2492390 RepID=UPI001184059F|nr:alkaline phosphatase family protein [Elioraea rosea]